jgi:hypothetical protein
VAVLLDLGKCVLLIVRFALGAFMMAAILVRVVTIRPLPYARCALVDRTWTPRLVIGDPRSVATLWTSLVSLVIHLLLKGLFVVQTAHGQVA